MSGFIREKTLILLETPFEYSKVLLFKLFRLFKLFKLFKLVTPKSFEDEIIDD
jgi:hypothetical protein